MTDLAEVVGVYKPATPSVAANLIGVALMSLTTVLPVVMAGGAA